MSLRGSEAQTESLPPDLPEEIFLDTSVFCARLKHDALRGRVEETTGRFSFRGTSSYVLLEYGNVILKEVKYFRNQLRRGMSLGDLQYRIVHEIPQPYNGNKLKWFFGLLQTHFNSPEAEERALLHMEEMLVVGTDEVRFLVDDVRDGIECPWIEPSGDWKRPHDCHRRVDRCGIAEFFRENAAVFGKLKAACEQAVVDGQDATGQLSRFADLIAQAQDDASVLSDYSACRQVGDALIAVQSQKYRCFLTQNFHDSRVLCRVLEQLLLELGQKLDEPVRARDYRRSAVTS